jgi:Major Facilitator Superfamily
VQSLVWVLSAYLLTYGGFMLLGGRAADLLGRRRVLTAGIFVIGISSLIGGFAGSSAVLVGARLAQGLGAAMTLPAALSILTTSFKEGKDRHAALGAWGGVGGLASAMGVLLGGVLTQGPGWRWVMFVNPIACVLVLGGVVRLIGSDRSREKLENFDALGAVLATGGMLLLVYALVEAPTIGWGNARTLGARGGAGVAGRVRGQRAPSPQPAGTAVDLPHKRSGVRGHHAADHVHRFPCDVLLPHPVHAGGAALLADPDRRRVPPGLLRDRRVSRNRITAPVRIRHQSGDHRRIADRGRRGLLAIAYPGRRSYLTDLLPGMVVMSLGFGPVFVGVTTAANAGVPANKAGLAAAGHRPQPLGGALGLAILTALATTQTQHLLAVHSSPAHALVSGFQHALLAGSVFLVAAAFVALRATNTRGEQSQPGAPLPCTPSPT